MSDADDAPELSPRTRVLLAQFRRGIEPTARARARVLQAVVRAGPASGHAPRRAAVALFVKSSLLGASLATGAFAGATLADRAQPSEVAVAAGIETVDREARVAPTGGHAPARYVAPPSIAPTPAPPVAPPERVMRPRASARAAAPVSVPASEPAPTPADELAAEVALIDAARTAVRARQWSRASAVLAEHQRRFPDGAMIEERAGWAAWIACATAQAGSRALADAFVRSYPSSHLIAGLRDVCSSTTDSPRPEQ